MTLSRRLAVFAGAMLLTTTALAGCASDAATAPSGTPTPDASAGSTVEIDVEAAWLDNGSMVGLVTLGSSTCVPMAEVGGYADGVLEVTLSEEADAACTRDLVPRVTLVDLPAEVDPTQSLEITVTGETGAGDAYAGDTDLDGVPGLVRAEMTDYLPSAGWTDIDGQFVILTWGSSTCVPVIEDVVASSDNEATVTFVTPPADQACTMDMVPRAIVAVVDGLDDEGSFAILQGGEFDNVRVPILAN